MNQELYSFVGAIMGAVIVMLAGREPLQRLIKALKSNSR